MPCRYFNSPMNFMLWSPGITLSEMDAHEAFAFWVLTCSPGLDTPTGLDLWKPASQRYNLCLDGATRFALARSVLVAHCGILQGLIEWDADTPSPAGPRWVPVRVISLKQYTATGRQSVQAISVCHSASHPIDSSYVSS